MSAVAPLLVTAVFVTMYLGLMAPPTGAGSPATTRAPVLVLAAMGAALLASIAATVVSALLVASLPPLSRPATAMVAFVAQASIVLPIAVGLARLWPARPPLPAALAGARRAALALAAGIGAVAGLVAQSAPSPFAAAALALGSAGLLTGLRVLAPFLRERLDAGDAPARLRGRPLALLSAAIVALAVIAALQSLRR